MTSLRRKQSIQSSNSITLLKSIIKDKHEKMKNVLETRVSLDKRKYFQPPYCKILV